MINKVRMKTCFDILVEATKIATISLGFSYIFFLGLVKADTMYEKTQSDIWAIMIIVVLCAVASSIIIGSGVYFCIFKKKENNFFETYKYINYFRCCVCWIDVSSISGTL